MSHTRSLGSMAIAAALVLAGCSDAVTEPVSADYEGRPPVFNGGCNGNNGSQLMAMPSTFGTPQQLQRVVVYGTPVQRPYRGFGDLTTYGAVTNVFVYDRNVLDQCSFGTDRTFADAGTVADDTLGTPIEAPDGISQDIWNSISPRIKKQLREAAWYLADHWVPNDIPGIGAVAREVRRGMIFAALAKGFTNAQSLTPDRRRETTMFAQYYRHNTNGLSTNETLRVDALLLACSTVQSYRSLNSWNPETAESYATRVVSAWGADQTESYTLRHLEPQLAHLAAIGATLGREGNSCGSAARYHFENRPTDLFDPQQGGGSDFFLF